MKKSFIRGVSWVCLLALLIGIPIKVSASGNTFPAYTGNSCSLVDGLNTIGVDSSFSYREEIADANGIDNYRGTAKENTILLNKLKAGLLIDPGASVPVTEEKGNVQHACENYDQCTITGAEVYIVTKDYCPIRREPHNKGEIAGRGQTGQLLSVNRTFITKKLTRWAELNTYTNAGELSDEKLYIHIDNCVPHATHDYITILETNNGYVEFCTVCGIAKAVTPTESAVCDLKCVSDQALKGSFSKYDTSFEGLLAQIIVGELPYVGTLADARDIVADVINKEPAWILGLDCMALIPIIGALKYSDEALVVAKNADELAMLAKNADDTADLAKKAGYIPWGKWSDYDKITINGKEYAKIGDFNYSDHAVEEFLNPSIETNYLRGKDGGLVEHSRGVPPAYVNYVLTEGVANGTTKVGKEYMKNGAKRIKYTSGTLDVVVEEGNIVVTIITR